MCFQARYYAEVTFYDLSKAFDSVEDAILNQKLAHHGLSNNNTKLINFFLLNHKACIGNEKSDVAKINCEVPQSYVLGSLLFILINKNLPLKKK